MARKKPTAEGIVAEPRQVEALTAQGRSVADAIRSIGVMEVTYYRWRKEYGGLKGDQVKRLKELEAEDARLRRRRAPAGADAGSKPVAPRVVLDTSILVSALVFRSGPPGEIRRAWTDGRCLPLVSAETAGELVAVLRHAKFELSPAEQGELLGDFLPYGEVVRVPGGDHGLPACRDPDDLMFFRLAEAGRASFLVSGNKDILALAGVFAVPIVTAADFLSALAQAAG